MIRVKETNEESPICPHCNKEISAIKSRSISSRFGKRFIYFCSNCNKALGVSHRKGFWMG